MNYTKALNELLKGNRVALSHWNLGTALFLVEKYRHSPDYELKIERKS